MSDAFDALIGRRPARAETPGPRLSRVVRVEGGTYVVPYGDDERYPTGPCRGPAVTIGQEVLLLELDDELPWVLTETQGSGGDGGDIDLPDLTLIFENGLI